jgi:hypothetical protein
MENGTCRIERYAGAPARGNQDDPAGGL